MKYILIKNELIIPLDKIDAVKIHKSNKDDVHNEFVYKCEPTISIQVGHLTHNHIYETDEEAQRDFDAIREAIHESTGASLGCVRFL